LTSGHRWRLRAGGRATPDAPATGYQVLTPGVTGPGVWAATTEPARQGSAAEVGYGTRAIANWSIVPYQDVTGTLNIGVVAFKAPTAAQYAAGITNAIAKVSFSLDGGPWTDVTTTALNPETGVVEYTAQFRASSVADGNHEIRAIVYPLTGYCRVLQGSIGNQVTQYSMFVAANYGGALLTNTVHISPSGNDSTGSGSLASPYATIFKAEAVLRAAMSNDVGGATILCAAGTYDFTPGVSTANLCAYRWLTIMPEPGVPRASVILTEPYALRRIYPKIQKMHLKNVTLAFIIFNENSGTLRTTGATWMDGVKFVGTGTTTDADADVTYNQAIYAAAWGGGVYHTGGEYSSCCEGATNSLLVRGTYVHNICGDAFSISKCVINVTVDNVAPAGGRHCDVYQIGVVTTYNNFLVFGATVTTAYGMLFKDTPQLTDLAIVDWVQVTDNAARAAMQFICNVANVLLLRLNITGPSTTTFRPSDGPYAMTNITIVDSVFDHPPTGGGGIVTTYP
jgi:hypothetical protein